MVDHYANSIEDSLTESLSFKLKPGGSYITDKRSVTFHPQGSNIYSTNGTKLIRLLLTGENWLDPQTVRICFDLVNTDPATSKWLRPVGGVHSFFQRARLLCGGVVVEDLCDYARSHELTYALTPLETQISEGAQGFGTPWHALEEAIGRPAHENSFCQIFGGGDSMTVLFKPCFGLFSEEQKKEIPLRYCPITIELELVSDPLAPIITGPAPFNDTNCSSSWQIQNVMAKCDILTLDSQLNNSYAEYLLSGKSIPINYSTYVSQIQTTLSGDNGQKNIKLSVTRALSRLRNVFISLVKSNPAYKTKLDTCWFRDWNHFYSPMSFIADGHFPAVVAVDGAVTDVVYPANINNHSDGEFSFQIAIGSKLFPEYPIRSHAEAYYQLSKVLKAQSHNLSAQNIDGVQYRVNRFIMCMNLEKINNELAFTGHSTKAGDIMNITFDHRGSVPSNYATAVHILMQSDNVLEIRDGGVQVYD